MNTRTLASAGVVAAAALLAACGSSVDLNQNKAPVETRRTGPSITTALPAAAPQSRVATVDTAAPQSTALPPAGNGAAAAANGRVVYFDFDSFAIKDEYKPLIEGHAKALASARTKRLTVEGHTDARGGSEYNLALGQKRAEAVARSLALLGATATQVEAVSFGKERPADPGAGEAAWAKNRRAELKDR